MLNTCKYILLFSIVLSFAACKKYMQPQAGLEKLYAAPGSYAVSVTELTNASGGKLYRVYYPSSASEPCPLITWGNGTGAGPDNYDDIMKHLAGWGFIVIDNYEKNTGTGKEILDAVSYMLAENTRSGSVFFNRVDANNIGAAGHSQGATGIINAHTRYPGGAAIRALVPIALPAQKWTENIHGYEPAQIQAALFLMSGKGDGLISSAKSNAETFAETDAALPAAMALAAGNGHNSITRDGGRHRGYLTAWFRYRLYSDTIAAAAFAGNDPELLRSEGWKDVRLKNLD